MNSETSRKIDGADAWQVVRDFGAEELFYLNRMTVLGQIVPNASHEINNTLQIIGGLCEILATKDLPADAKDKLAKIAGQNARAVELVHQVVSFVRREGFGQSRVDVAKCVHQALTMRRYHLSRAGIQTAVQSPDDQSAIVGVDAHSMQQVVLNLIGNAEQALSGREGGRLEIDVARDGGLVRLRLRDNGRGMTDMVRTRAFEAFFTTHRERAGLGLTVSKAIVEKSGGTIALTSEPGAGAMVEVTVPGK